MTEQTVIMDENAVGRTLSRLAHEIIETNPEETTVCLVGIKRRGVPLAARIAEKMTAIEGTAPAVGEVDITFYRDDLTTRSEQPVLNATRIDFDVTGKDVVLVDDVIYTGRTVRAAIDALFAIGRPQSIQLAALVDRGHRELPIRADYVGKNLPTSREEKVRVLMKETDGEDRVVILE